MDKRSAALIIKTQKKEKTLIEKMRNCQSAETYELTAQMLKMAPNSNAEPEQGAMKLDHVTDFMVIPSGAGYILSSNWLYVT